MNNICYSDGVYLDYKDKVNSYIRSRIINSHDAEDLFSSVFLKVYANLEAYDSAKASMNTWIYTITQNTVCDYYRDKKRQGKFMPYEEIEILEDESPSPGDQLLNEESLEELAEMLEKLPERERDIIILRYYQGYSSKKISELMGISYANARYLQSMALKKLRELIDSNGIPSTKKCSRASVYL